MREHEFAVPPELMAWSSERPSFQFCDDDAINDLFDQMLDGPAPRSSQNAPSAKALLEASDDDEN